MAGHFLLSPASRDYTIEKVDRMSGVAVHAFFARCRWGDDDTQTCPECGTIASHYWVKTRRQWRCREVACGRSFSVTSGTKFADHKMPLKTILKAMVVFATNVKGISACAMARQLGIAYQTAFVLLHKLRESIIEGADRSPMDGLIHLDGAHVSGRIRKPRVKLDSTKTQARSKIDVADNPDHTNRRIVMVIRKVSEEPGVGALRSIVAIIPAETRAHTSGLIRQYVDKGSTIMTDESPAYSSLMARYDHKTVNHKTEFSTDAGVNNNQAESYFSRMRRMIIGQVHRVAPKYMHDYMSEVAWREDVRRTPTSRQVRSLLTMSMKTPSVWWNGYWQGRSRAHEVLYVPAPDVG